MSLCVDLTAGGTAPDGEPVEIGGKARSLLRLAARGLSGAGGLRGHRRSLPAAARRGAGAAAGAARCRRPGRARPRARRAGHSALASRVSRRARPSPRSSRPAMSRAPASRCGRRSRARTAPTRSPPASTNRSSASPAATVPAAIRRVLASGLSPGAVTYARAAARRARSGRHGAAGRGAHSRLRRRSGGQRRIRPDRRPVPRSSRSRPATRSPRPRAPISSARFAIWRRARATPSRSNGCSTETELVLLQLRAYAAPPPARAWTPGAALGPGAWRWDAAHNPLPLSPAQAGLVELCDARCRIGIRQRVAGGYLFYAPDGPAPAQAIDPGAVGDELAALVARFEDWQRAHTGPPALEDALAIFVELYDRIYGLIQPAARRATRALDDFLRAHLGGEVGALPDLYAGVESMADERLARADDLRSAAIRRRAHRAARRLPGALRRRSSRSGTSPRRPTARNPRGCCRCRRRHRSERRVAEASAAIVAASGARDRDAPRARRPSHLRDLARGRAARARGGRGRRLALRARAGRGARGAASRGRAPGRRRAARDCRATSSGCRSSACARGRPASRRERATELQAQVAAARADHARALHDPPELAGDGEGDCDSQVALGGVIRGQRASAGRALGRAVVYRATARSPERAPGAGAIVVAATLLPTELPLISAAGLVVETGGVLDHVAAQARERGIPAIVGARGACSAIADGDLVLLDADAGQLIRLGRSGFAASDALPPLGRLVVVGQVLEDDFVEALVADQIREGVLAAAGRAAARDRRGIGHRACDACGGAAWPAGSPITAAGRMRAVGSDETGACGAPGADCRRRPRRCAGRPRRRPTTRRPWAAASSRSASP